MATRRLDEDPAFGRWLNTVDIHRCPMHGKDLPMNVFENGVRWECGHGRPLPPLVKGPGRPRDGLPEKVQITVQAE